ncbi:MAG: hypothetical protein E6K73_11860, partial [Candidatus Eisenbacteria bacterium]
VLQTFEFSRITQKNQYAGTPMSVSLTARDPNGLVVSGFSGWVRIKEITSFGDGRCGPDSVLLSGGSWNGSISMYRADETSINRGNVNLYAWLPAAPAKNGTSDPFTVHPATFARLQIVVPGQTPLPGSLSGLSGTPATQGAGRTFPVTVYGTDSYWNPVPSGDNVRVISSDPAANTPLTGALSNGSIQFSVRLGTVGTQTLTASDLTSSTIASMTSLGIQVIPDAFHHFAVSTVPSPMVAGAPTPVTISAADANGNAVTGFSGAARLSANTGPGSFSPEDITLTNGVWIGPVTFFGAGGAVSFTVSDYAAPPHTGASNTVTVQPGPLAGLQVLLPGESPLGGTSAGKTGTPVTQSAGSAFTLTVRAVDAYWNLVPTAGPLVSLGSSDAFAAIPAETTLASGQRLIQAKLFRSGPQRIWVSDLDDAAIVPDTSSVVQVVGGPFARVLVLAPGESPAPGLPNGRTGNATDQSINYSFNVTVLSTDSWWNPVGGVTDVVHITSDDPLAQLPADTPLVDGRVELPVRLARGGYNQITVGDVTRPAIQGSSTQVRAISSGFHLEASASPASVRAGDAFTLNVRVTNDAGSTIQEINSFVTLEVRNASTNRAGRGTLLTMQFQLLQGQRIVSETYTFAEPIVVIARDDAGNAPATSNPVVVTPGPPAAIALTSLPLWVGGNKHAEVRARLVDAYDNGVPDQPMSFAILSGNGTLGSFPDDPQRRTTVDTTFTDSSGVAHCDFLSPRQPEHDLLRADSGPITAQLDVETAFVDPNAQGGTVTNYPNPFHPPDQPTTIAYKLDDNAAVTIRIFTQSGDLVMSKTFDRGTAGGQAGLNQFVWDGRNGAHQPVASGGYLALIEAQGTGETLHVMRRKIAAVR